MNSIKQVLQKIEETILISCLLVMGIALVLQIVMRFLFDSPLQWVEELARYLQIWITFLGIGYGVRRGSHISMTLLRDKMPKAVQYLMQMICNVAILAAFVILLQTSVIFLESQTMVSTALEIPMQIVYAVIPVGTISYMLYVIADMVALTKAQFQKETMKEEAL